MALLLGACTSGPVVPATKPVASTERESPSTQDCQNWNLIGTPITPSIENLSKTSPVVVVATFTGYGQPFWDTADGKAPPKDVVLHGDAEILTRVALDVNGEVKGEREVADRAVVFGGTVGCDAFTSSENPELVAGSKYVMFLEPQTKDGKETGNTWIVAAWPVGPGDSVATPADGPRSLSQLISEIRAGKPESTHEPAAEPTSGYP